jgi:hypothetical protein
MVGGEWDEPEWVTCMHCDGSGEREWLDCEVCIEEEDLA